MDNPRLLPVDWPRAARLDERHPVETGITVRWRTSPPLPPPRRPDRGAANQATATGSADARLPRHARSRPLEQLQTRRLPARLRRSRTVRVVTDVLDLDISLQGGASSVPTCSSIRGDKKAGSPPSGCSARRSRNFSVARTGLRALNGKAEPTHLAVYTARRTSTSGAGRTGTQGADHLDGRAGRHGHQDLPLQAGPLRRAGDLRRRQPFGQRMVGHLVRATRPPRLHGERSMFDVESYCVPGPAIYDGNKYRQARRHGRRRGQVRAERHGWLDRHDAAPLRERRRAPAARSTTSRSA